MTIGTTHGTSSANAKSSNPPTVPINSKAQTAQSKKPSSHLA
nr:MAG TPA: hypothetical protein [Herelleviridae sp.]